MAKFKKIAAILSSAAILVSTMSIPATASYIDGDREVDYYSFSIIAGYNYEGDPDVPITDGIDKRHESRNWVVSVNEVSTTRYPVKYSVHRSNDPANPNNNLGYTEQIATSCSVKGTGNKGGSYTVDVCAGTTIYMSAIVGSSASAGLVVTTSGQWSPDAPY